MIINHCALSDHWSDCAVLDCCFNWSHARQGTGAGGAAARGGGAGATGACGRST